MSDPAAQPMAHGPGGLLGTPGLRASKRLRQALKDSGYGARAGETIRGNLKRGNDGKFSSANNPSAAKPAAKPNPKANLRFGRAKPKPKKGGAKGPKPKDPAVAARQAQRDREHAEDRAQRQADRQARLERQAQRDQERTADRIERAAQRTGREADRIAKQQEAARKKLLAAAAKKKPSGGSKKPSKPETPKPLAVAPSKRVQARPAPSVSSGGGKQSGGAAKKPGAAPESAQRASATAAQVGMPPADLGALQQAAETGGAQSARLAELGLIDGNGEATDQGRRALSAIERGSVRQYQAAIQDARARLSREAAAAQRKRDAEQKKTKSSGFAVFKDHSGAYRWIARTTTAYRDRDGEIISAAALDADSQRMTATKQFGPLRWWHVGTPDLANPEAPWGPGLDIGDCDFSTLIGRTRVESGTFRSPVIAQKMAAVADRLEMSPGFFHAPDQPDATKTFTAIRTFERSPVPTRYGRASNLFTGFSIKEFRMDATEMERRFKAMYTELGLTPEQGAELGQQLVATEKAAAAQGVAYKSESALDVITAPMPGQRFKDAAGGEYIKSPSEQDPTGKYYATMFKAAPPVDLVPEPGALTKTDAETKADVPVPMDDVVEEVAADTGMADTDLIEMIAGRTADMLMERLTPLFGDMKMSEFKTLLSGYATKEAGTAAEIAAIKSTLAQIAGDQPAFVMPDEVREALKSAGPQVPADPDAPETVNDPNRPLAGIAARTMPALYKTNPGGEFTGWVPLTNQ